MNAIEKVESNEGLLVEILTCLPVKSIFRFMCVSKRWEKIIKTPFFLKSYSLRRRRSCSDGGRLLALFQRSVNLRHNNEGLIDLACQNPTNMLTVNRTTWGDRIHNIPRQFGRFITSSNGLILCSPDQDEHHFVVNPVTGKSVTLPPPPPLPESSLIYPPYEYFSVGLMCEENTSELKPNFIVTQAYTRISRSCSGQSSMDREKYKSMQIQTYSSMTGEWTLSTLVATDEIALSLEPPMVVNGVFYWRAYYDVFYWRGYYEYSKYLVVYDPKNKDENKVQLIQLPMYTVSSVRLSPDGILWSSGYNWMDPKMQLLSGYNWRDPKIQLWMLPNKGEDRSYKTIAKEEWILKYIIDLPYKAEMSFEGFISWDPIVVLLHVWKLEKLLLYNVESESIVEMVEYDGALVPGEFYFYAYKRMCPLMESSFLSSYAL